MFERFCIYKMLARELKVLDNIKVEAEEYKNQSICRTNSTP